MTAKNNNEIENKVKVCATIQVERGLGARINPPDARDIHLAQVQAPVAVPMAYETDLSILPVENQKAWGTCVGQGEGKGMEYFELKETKKFTRLSKRYLYIKCKKIDGIPNEQGTFPRTAAKVLFDNGIAEEKLIPDNNDLAYSEYMGAQITADVDKNARIRRVNGYATVANSIDAIKQAIYQNGVVSATLQVGDWSTMPLKPVPSYGLHRILFKGYREITNTNGVRDLEIRFRNSWGPEWGLGGDGIILWSEYKDFIYDLMTYVDLPNEVLEDVKNKSYIFTRTIKYNSTGIEVMELQKRLSKTPEKFYNYKKNGELYFTTYFGRETEKALKAYQKARGLVSWGTPATTGYGQLGPKTRAKLNAEPIYTEEKKTELDTLIIKGLIPVESNGNDNAIGDLHLSQKAYGPLQIREPVCIDVNRKYGTNYKATDMLGNRPLSIDVCKKYLGIYATEKAIGRPVTDQDRARIWNGGPTGWKRSTTLAYWKKVSARLAAGSSEGPDEKVEINNPKKKSNMLTTIAIILLIAWLLGIVGVYTIGWFLHVLLVVAIVMFLVDVIQGRRDRL